MTSLLRTPHERLLPAWLGVSLVVHAVVLTGGSALVNTGSTPAATPQVTRVLLSGRIMQPVATLPKAPAPTETTETVPPTPQTTSPARRAHSIRPSRPAQRAARDTRSSASGATPSSAQPPAQAVGGFADAAPEPEETHSASAPEMGRPGAAWAGPLAGGGAQVLTTEGGGPVSFQVASAPGGGGGGPGIGGSGSGLGVGGSSGGVGGGGTPGGTGLSSGGAGGGTSGHVDPLGTVGGGGRPGSTSGAPTPPAATATGARPGPSPAERATPASRPAPAPELVEEPKPEPAPTPAPKPDPGPSQADLSRFRSMVQSRINGAKRYPSSARDAGQHGTVRVSFRVSSGGQPSGISVSSSSGYQSLDAAAKRAVSSAAPYRPFPKGMTSSIRVTATVVFRLN